MIRKVLLTKTGKVPLLFVSILSISCRFWRVIGGISYYRYCGKNDQRYAISYPVPTGSLPIDSKHHALL